MEPLLIGQAANISLSEVWDLWWVGTDISNRKLWHLEIFWWGRIGKLFQFIAACFIVIDIVGPERIHLLAEELREKAKNRYAKISKLTRRFNKFVGERESFGWWQICLGILLLVLTSTTTLIIAYIAGQSFWFVFFLNFRLEELGITTLEFLLTSTLALVTSIGFIFTTWIILSYSILATINFSILFTKSIAWVLENKNLEFKLKVISFILVTVGFPLDYLAS